MKKFILFSIMIIPVYGVAQNVGINTNSPASTLTINGVNPDIGIMNNGLAHAFMKAGLSDFTIGTSPDNAVGKLILGTKDNNHFNIDALGRVSIGTNSSFDAELKLNGNGSVRFALMNNNVNKAFMMLQGNDFRMGTYGTGEKIVFAPQAVDRVWITEDGRVGIGTANPVSDLTINGVNPYIQIQQSGINKGFFQIVTNDLRLGTNSTNTTGKLLLQTKLISRLTIDEEGLVGIGTTNPGEILTIDATDPIIQIKNNGVEKGFIQSVDNNIKIGTYASNPGGEFIIRTNGFDRLWCHENGRITMGTSLSQGGQLSIGNDYNTASINFFNGNTNTFNISSFGGNAWVETWTDQLILRAGSGASLYLKNNGQATIGLVSPANGHRLTVLGKIACDEVTSSNTYAWPDYVFEDNYALRSLHDLDKFIRENKHLPNIPPASEIEKNGIQLGDMSRRLVEKVEELTLYILQQQKQIDELKKQVATTREK